MIGGRARKQGLNALKPRDDRVRVMYYNHSADFSGAEISLLLMVSHMRAKAVDTMLVAPSGELTNVAREQGIPVVPVRSYRARMTRNPLLLFKGLLGTLGAGLELRQVIGQTAPDIVHANSIRAGLIALVGVIGRRTQLIWHVRDNLPNNVVGKVIRIVASWRANKVFAISNAIATDFSVGRRLKTLTEIVHNGIDIRKTAGFSIRLNEDTPPNSFVVGVVGQIAPWKRQHDAINAFAAFHRDVPNSELWIVGEPKFRRENVKYLDKLRLTAERLGVSESVRFLGFREDVDNIMASIDALLVPSENEPFGRVVIEAMLAGKPVIGTNGGGIPEIVADQETGYLVGTGDTTGIADKLRILYENKLLASQMGARGQTRIYHNFSIQSKVEQIYAAYLVLIPKTPTRRFSHETTKYRLGG